MQNLRLGLSKTYTLINLKKEHLYLWGNFKKKVGNKDLYASDDYNLDLKWKCFKKWRVTISYSIW
jgi:hypothetical protein